MGNEAINTKPILEDLNPMPMVPISPEELEDMKKYFEELLEQDGDSNGLNPDSITDTLKDEFKVPEEVCTSIEAKIRIASEYGDVTTIEIEAIICEEFGVSNFDELGEILDGDKPQFDEDKPVMEEGGILYKNDDVSAEVPSNTDTSGGHFKVPGLG